MTSHTNPPGTLEAPSSPIPADAGGAVEVAVPPAGRVSAAQRNALKRLAADGPRSAYPGLTISTLEKLEHRCLVKAQRGLGSMWSPATIIKWSITPAGRRLLKEGK